MEYVELFEDNINFYKHKLSFFLMQIKKIMNYLTHMN